MSVELVAVEDCWVNDFPENRDRNLDKMGLGIGRWEALNRSYVKFDLSEVPFAREAVKYAELRLYGRALIKPCIVEAVHTWPSWREETLTWNTQPGTLKVDGKLVMGSTTDIPEEEGWFSVPIDLDFIYARWGRKLSIMLLGYEEPRDSYCYAYDKEEAGGAYAPRLIISTAPPKPPAPKAPWAGLASIAVGMGLLLVKPPRSASP